MAQIQFHNRVDRVHHNNENNKMFFYENVGSREDTSKLKYFFHLYYETLSLCILQNVSVISIKN